MSNSQADGKTKIVVFGGTGRLGRHIVEEARRRGHAVTIAAREPGRQETSGSPCETVTADVTAPEAVAAAVEAHDVVISAVGPSASSDDEPRVVTEAARALLRALPGAGLSRLVAIGATGTLQVAPDVQLVDLPEFPRDYVPIATAHGRALELLQREGSQLDWTVLSPPAAISSGERTGAYRTGTDGPLSDDGGAISAADLAVAVLDEIESPKHLQEQFTVAY